MALPDDVDAHDLRQTGWGVIFPQGKGGRYESFLGPLLELRRSQAGRRFDRFSCKPGEPAPTFLRRHGEIVGTIRPERVPYYLLIVGSPEEISFEFQYQLNVDHAVGRIYFDEPLDWASYAKSVRDAERRPVRLPRRATIFSVVDNWATEQLDRHLVQPLRRSLPGYGTPGWEVDVLNGERSSKAHLSRLLGGGDVPGLLLACCHGLRGSASSPLDQRARQGALICRRTPAGEKECFAAADVPADARLHGLIGFFFACHSAGTPVLDNFPQVDGPLDLLRSEPEVIAEEPFVARLPQALLSRGALAVVGNVDRGWVHSFSWEVEGEQVGAAHSIEDCLQRLLRGNRLGHSLRPLYRRYTALAARLAMAFDNVRHGAMADVKKLGEDWRALHDARNFIVLGDPAVYLLGQRPRSGEARRSVKLRTAVLDRARERAEERGLSVEEWLEGMVETTVRND